MVKGQLSDLEIERTVSKAYMYHIIHTYILPRKWSLHFKCMYHSGARDKMGLELHYKKKGSGPSLIPSKYVTFSTLLNRI